jgi:adenosine deaminase
MNLKQLPKIDLHLHLDGAIRVATIAELGDELGVKLPTYDPRELAKFVQVDRNCRNLQTCSVPSLAKHPFKKFFDEKVRVTLNTDDPTISNITHTDEFELAAREYKLTPAQIRELLLNAANAAFAEPSVRSPLAKSLACNALRDPNPRRRAT